MIKANARACRYAALIALVLAITGYLYFRLKGIYFSSAGSNGILVFGIILLPRLVLLLGFAFSIGGIFLALKHSKYRRIFLSFYTALLVLFLADAVFDGRSIPGHLRRWVNGEPGIIQSAHDYFEDTRKTVDPQELQRWAVAMLQPRAQTNSAVAIPPDKVPAYILNPKGFYLKEPRVRDGAVYLEWGGGLGHFGICVGPPTFKVVPPSADDNDRTSYVEWKPGIYFWIE